MTKLCKLRFCALCDQVIASEDTILLIQFLLRWFVMIFTGKYSAGRQVGGRLAG